MILVTPDNKMNIFIYELQKSLYLSYVRKLTCPICRPIPKYGRVAANERRGGCR